MAKFDEGNLEQRHNETFLKMTALQNGIPWPLPALPTSTTFKTPEQLNAAISTAMQRMEYVAQLDSKIPDYIKRRIGNEGLTTLLNREGTERFLTTIDNAIENNDPAALGLSSRIKNFYSILDESARTGITNYRTTYSPTPISREEALRNLLPPEEPRPLVSPQPGQLEPSQPGSIPQPQINPPLYQPGTPQPLIPPQGVVTGQPVQLPPGSTQVPIIGPNGVPVVRRDIPSNVDPTSDRAKIEQEAVRQQDQARAIAEAQSQAYLQAIGQYQQGLSGQRPLVEQEAQRQNQQIRALGTEIGGFQQQRLSDLGNLLNQRQSDLFQRATPQLAEQAQTAGLLQSSGFGEALARQYTDLTADTQYQLGTQALADRDLQTQLLQQGLGQQQQLQTGGLQLQTGAQADVSGKLLGAEEQRIQNIADILGRRQQLQLSGLQREFSVEDLEKSAELAGRYGLQMAPQTGGGGSAFGSLLGGVGAGAAAGSAFGPMGAGIGAAVGGVGGLLTGGKRGK